MCGGIVSRERVLSVERGERKSESNKLVVFVLNFYYKRKRKVEVE